VSAAEAASRRRVKVRGGPLAWYLCWAVVFADIGTSVYYTPGILFGDFRNRSALFVGMTLIAFILLTIKYAEVAWRYPEGGGVVNVASRAIHPFAGLLGGSFILVDYYLTVALSALSGVFYLNVVLPSITNVVVPVTVAALVLLALLNAFGIKESASTTAVFAVAAGLGQLVVVLAVVVSLGPVGVVHSFGAILHGKPLTPITLVTGFGAAFLAFSGLETIAQLAPSMREPRRRIAAQAMIAVVVTMVFTSPFLTLWSTTLLPSGQNPNQFISLLGLHVAGPVLGDYVAVTGALLLIFASNTGMIGAYHVFIALSRMGFLPRVLEQRNRWRGTPHWAIMLAVGVPIILVAISRGNPGVLGDLYAFGLLGAFILTCIALDIVRWRDPTYRKSRKGQILFILGVATTVLVLIAWLTNLVAKPEATMFGGGLTVLGLIVGLTTYYVSRSREPIVFPFLHRPDLPVVPIGTGNRRLPECDVLAILPHDPTAAEAVVAAATRSASGDQRLVFLYRGETPDAREAELLEVTDPYLTDRAAQVAFGRAERAARKSTRNRRYIYMPGNLRPDVVGDVWKSVFPRETVVLDGDQGQLPPIAVDRVRRRYIDGYPILRLVTGRLRHVVGAD
jgi:amino acid transporter